jgi:hypothetical protein
MNGGGTPINAVEADLSYPASQLQYVGINYSGGAFTINTPTNGGGNGSVSIQNGSVTPISGSALIATVTFKALASSGSAAINVAGSSNLINANTNTTVPYYGSGTSVKFGVVAIAPTAAASPAPPADKSAPTISNIALHNVSPLGATIQWTTNEPADSVVDFGLDNSYGLSSSASGLTTAHSVTLNSTFLTPETLFHYHVKSSDASGNVATSADKVFTLPGIPVTINIRGPNGKALAGATVTLDNATGTTDTKGIVVLPSGTGNKKVVVQFGGVSVQKNITVARSTKAAPAITIDVGSQPLNRWAAIALTLLIVVISLIGIDAVLFGSHFFARLAGLRHMPKINPIAQQAPVDPPVKADSSVVDSLAASSTALQPAQHLSTAVSQPATVSDTSAKDGLAIHVPISPEKLTEDSAPMSAMEPVLLRQSSSKKPAIHHKKANLKRSTI